MKTKRHNAIAWSKRGRKRTRKIKRNEWKFILKFKNNTIYDTIYADHLYQGIFKVKHKYKTLLNNLNVGEFTAKFIEGNFIVNLQDYEYKD